MAPLLQHFPLGITLLLGTTPSSFAQIAPAHKLHAQEVAKPHSLPVNPAPVAAEQTQSATGRLSGTLLDSTTHRPVSFAAVALLAFPSGRLVTGVTADEQGRFGLAHLAAGQYQLTISSIGYETKSVGPIALPEDGNIALGPIRLSSGSYQLKEVEVVGQKALVETTADRLIFNAENDATLKGGNAADVMRKVPMITVDLDGNLLLRGSQNVRVLINNKPSAMVAGSVAEALKQIPAGIIKAVEVITSPSAKYDAEGSAGIINIVTKLQTLEGFSLSMDSGLGNRGGSLGLNGSYRKGKMGFSLNGSGWINYNIKGAFKNTQRIGQTTSWQAAHTRSHAQLGQYTLGWDYDITPRNFLTASIRFGARNSFASQDNLVTQSFPGEALLPHTSVRNVLTRDLSRSMDVTTMYTHSFKPNREISILTLYSRNDRRSAFTADLLDTTDRVSLQSRERNDNPSLNQEMTLQADYQTLLGRNHLVEGGSKGIFRQVNSDYTYAQDGTGTGEYVSNARFPANGLRYGQQVMAGYVAYTLTSPKQFTLKAGVRYEYTWVRAQLQYPATSGLSEAISRLPNYGNWSPSLAISQAFKGGQTVKVAYNRRLQRPGIQYLNPNPNAANPLAITEGNPALGPELSDHLELGASATVKGTYLNAALFARLTRDAIQPVGDTLTVTVQEGSSLESQPVLRTSYQNIGREQAYGMNLTGNATLFSNWQLGGGMDFYYTYLTNTHPDPIYAGTNAGWVVAGRLYSSLLLKKGWSVQGFGLLLARQVQVQGYQGGFTFYMLGMKKNFNNKRGSIGLAAENFLNHPFKVRTQLSSPVLLQQSVTSYYNAGFRVNFSYRVGKLSTGQPADRRRKSISNDDVKGGMDKGGTHNGQ